ncbi:hypothetical protein M0802_011219 [Mischocyttarus mexicanus]|nr:hypothetical protein M0802_011219 [Mischocyttarus mexicanus]
MYARVILDRNGNNGRLSLMYVSLSYFLFSSLLFVLSPTPYIPFLFLPTLEEEEEEGGTPDTAVIFPLDLFPCTTSVIDPGLKIGTKTILTVREPAIMRLPLIDYSNTDDDNCSSWESETSWSN